jgi:hypothetical protein
MDGPGAPADVPARSDVVREWLGQIDAGSADWESTLSPVAMSLVDALLDADAASLQEMSDPVRDALADLFDDAEHTRELRGYLLAMLAVTRWGLQRLPDPDALAIDRDTQAWKMLVELGKGSSVSSGELRQRLRTNESQVSRVGRQLLAAGLVAQRRIGRTATWELTPRGRQVMRHAADNQRHTRVR